MRRLLAISLAVLFALALAGAGELLAQGQFKAAYESAAKEGNWVLAARAASFYAMYQAEGKKERSAWFARAEAAAKRAIQAEPKNPEAYFELARALGRLAQYRGILQSLSLAAGVRDNLKKALALKPDYASALVALALWHLELSQKGVGWLYGADAGKVIPLFERAIELEPDRIIHRYEYARALYRLGKRREALKQLEVALSLPPRDARDTYVLAEAQELLEQLLKK